MPAWLNLPNLLTAVRLVLTVPVVLLTLAGDHGLALALFIAAGTTDLLDGLAARRLGAATTLGAYFDPIADKCLLSAVFLALAAVGTAPWWFVGLALGRDLLILCGAGFLLASAGLRRFPPSRWGKLSTFFQISAATVWMVRNAWSPDWVEGLARVALWTSAAFTLASGVDYLRSGVSMWRGRAR